MQTVIPQSVQSSGLRGDFKSTHPTSRLFQSSSPGSKGESESKSGGMGSSSSNSFTSRDKGVSTLSRTEWEERRKKGLCYRCGQLYGPTHRWPEGKLRVLLLGEDEDNADIGEHFMMTVLPSIPLLQDSEPPKGICQVLEAMGSCTQLSGHQTLQLKGILLGIPICLLVDSGANISTVSFCSSYSFSFSGWHQNSIGGWLCSGGDNPMSTVIYTSGSLYFCYQCVDLQYVLIGSYFGNGLTAILRPSYS
ncbi:hypothetical protein E3N88_00081 [Mikania micrantha]|uniref:Uncharacterized protein n=1 Tax=Mikania micrantha TaxID=192012 RepID=A0A5N6PX24_9ASTR|nr:hypothetical protein E3N88_00081 [Mikania micrantha]